MHRINEIKKYYDANLREGAPDYSLLGWESRDAQYARFDALISSLVLNGKRVLDVGCGTGSLYEYFKYKGINVIYTGVDILERMVSTAKSKCPDVEFYCMDIFKSNPFEPEAFDIVFASGIFNINLNNNKKFLLEALELFTFLSCESIAFNLLHMNSPDREDRYRYFHPDEVMEMLGRLPWKNMKINIIEDYLKNDFTVILNK